MLGRLAFADQRNRGIVSAIIVRGSMNVELVEIGRSNVADSASLQAIAVEIRIQKTAPCQAARPRRDLRSQKMRPQKNPA